MSRDLVERAWLAGFFDGEGCVHLCARHTAHVQITGTCPRTRDRILELLGRWHVNVSVLAQRPLKTTHKPAWRIAVRRRDDIGLLASMLGPLAVTKAEQWRVIAEWAEMAHVRGRQRTDAELAQGERLRTRLRVLNQRGMRS